MKRLFVIFAACIKVAKNELPVIAIFFRVKVNGDSPAEIAHLDRIVKKTRNDNFIAEALARFVN